MKEVFKSNMFTSRSLSSSAEANASQFMSLCNFVPFLSLIHTRLPFFAILPFICLSVLAGGQKRGERKERKL
jgi:hypothetical protein